MNASHLRAGLASAALTAMIAGTGGALALEAPTETQITVGPRTEIRAPSPSPVDFPGFRHDKPGQALPTGYVVISHLVTIKRGHGSAVYPAMSVACPGTTTLRTFAAQGSVGPQVIGPSPNVRRRSYDYIGKRSFGILIDYSRRTTDVGQTATGKVYALCR